VIRKNLFSERYERENDILFKRKSHKLAHINIPYIVQKEIITVWTCIACGATEKATRSTHS
jgi:hypothetical protein